MSVRSLSRHGLAAMASAFVGDAALASDAYPDVPEPMIFDMMRPLGAKRGELEVNTLATVPLSGDDDAVHWAPEIEYAFADGFAIEGELPFVNGRLAELKLGLQASFGTTGGGRTGHGVQYLGIYDRRAKQYRSSFAYMAAHRYNSRWSSVTMAGLADVKLSGGHGRNGVILNHSAFYDSREGQVLGLEINYQGGSEGGLLLMPQLHQQLGGNFAMQAGLGAERPRGDVFRPTAGLRIIRQF